MNNFSIVDTVSSAFKDYKNHWGLLVLAAAASSGVWLLRPLLSPTQQIQTGATVEELYQGSKTPQDFVKQLKTIAAKTTGKTEKRTPWARSLDLVLYLVSLLLQLGFVKICLELIDSGASSFNVLFSQLHCFAPAVGATLLFFIGAFTLSFLLILVCGILLSAFPASSFVIPFCMVLAVAVFLLVVTPFAFYQWCIVDKQTGAIGAFLCSWEKVKDQFKKVILFFLIIIVVSVFVQQLLTFFFTFLFQFVLPVWTIERFAFGYFCASALIMPLGYLMFAHAYRNLD